MSKAFETGRYRNLFAEYGYDEKEINKRLTEIWNTMFFGSEEERIYFESGENMAYVMDTGNNDVRTEGMSYAMMMSVQLNNKEVFDRVWTWTKKFMWLDSGVNAGYFAWSVSPEGVKNSYGPAPDGEEFFAMALFFASNRWGDGEGIYQYSKEARHILSACLHNEFPMWNLENKLIKFVPSLEFSDPSYHLPHFYELFALWANEEDREFWKEAAKASREYLKIACHPVTGLSAEYAEYDGTPHNRDNHHRFYSDSYRVAANIGIDNVWFGPDSMLTLCMENLQKFFCETVKGEENYIYEIDGTKINEEILHPVALIATNAVASLATSGENARVCVDKFWNTPLRTGERRYYDNCLYLFSFLTLSGNYRIWK